MSGIPEVIGELRDLLAVIETSAMMLERHGEDADARSRHAARIRRAVRRSNSATRSLERHLLPPAE